MDEQIQKNLEGPKEDDDQESSKLLNKQLKQTPLQQFLRQRNMARECCDLGRKYLNQPNYQLASKQFSKAVMTFQYILKNNFRQNVKKQDIAQMLNSIIKPAYSNLSLCYLKMQRYQMVITFANQVLTLDPANIKNLYRRAIAYKCTKAFDQAIKDFQLVIKLDDSMKSQCIKLMHEVKLLQKQQRKKDKQLAKSLIQGYSEQKPQPVQLEQDIGVSQNIKGISFWKKITNCIKSYCPKVFK